MKKLISSLAVLFFIVSPCFGYDVTVTIFPIYDWVREISRGMNPNITLLLDNGVDLHSYQPSVNDIVKLSEADIFIYTGGESDEWVNDALKNSTNRNQRVINLLDLLGEAVKPEEIIEGMEHEHEHEHNHEHESEFDEHVWLSLRNAKIICSRIAEVLSEVDPSHKDTYSKNLTEYTSRLSALDEMYQSVIDGSLRQVVLFGDRFPFRYMADDYDLRYYAAFSGCSAESEASFETVMFLADKVNELELPCILKIEGTRHKIAETISLSSKAKNQRILVLNSMQSTTSRDISEGAEYLSIMRNNLEVLKEALN